MSPDNYEVCILESSAIAYLCILSRPGASAEEPVPVRRLGRQVPQWVPDADPKCCLRLSVIVLTISQYVNISRM